MPLALNIDLDEINAVCSIYFGFKYGEGSKLTPKQYRKLIKHYKQKLRIDESRYALVCATIANCNRRKGTRAFKVKDFMAKDDKARSSKEQKLLLQKLFGR